MNFDTHESIKFLIGQGLKEKHAESIVKVVNQSRNFDFEKLATKEQLNTVKAELRAEIAEVKSEVAIVRSEVATVREEIKSSKYDIIKWLLPFLVGILIAIFFKH